MFNTPGQCTNGMSLDGTRTPETARTPRQQGYQDSKYTKKAKTPGQYKHQDSKEIKTTEDSKLLGTHGFRANWGAMYSWLFYAGAMGEWVLCNTIQL